MRRTMGNVFGRVVLGGRAVLEGFSVRGRLAVLGGLAVLGLASCEEEVPEPIEVSLRFELHAPDSAPAYVDGTTNLPRGTQLVVNLSEDRPASIVRSAETEVASDGTFRADELTKESAPPPGAYLLNVVMPVATRQPEKVLERIGRGGELLEGPLVRKSPFGAAVRSERRIVLGGEAALDKQKARAAEDAIALQAILDEVESAKADLEESLTRLRAPEDVGTVWQGFQAVFSLRMRSLGERLEKVGRSTDPRAVQVAFDAVRTMFDNASQANPTTYQAAAKRYRDNHRDARRDVAVLREYAGLPPRSLEVPVQRPTPPVVHEPASEPPRPPVVPDEPSSRDDAP